VPITKKIGLFIVCAWFLFGGIGHFAATGFFVSIVPPYIPMPLAAVYVSGVFELLGAIGVLLPATRRAAGIGLILLVLAVTPANVWMWQHPELYPKFPEWTLSVRLVVQVLLLVIIYRATVARDPVPVGGA
jgi:uncharacterized membrane protein